MVWAVFAPGQDSNPNMDTRTLPIWITGFPPKGNKGGEMCRWRRDMCLFSFPMGYILSADVETEAQ